MERTITNSANIDSRATIRDWPTLDVLEADDEIDESDFLCDESED